MSTESAASIMTGRLAQLKQKREGLLDNVPVYETRPQKIIIKPMASDWETLEKKLAVVVNFPGLLKTVKELYEQGFGAELETAIEIAQAKARKSPFCLFAAMVSKNSGNWDSKTLKLVRETWDVRRNSLEVIERLNLKPDSIKAIFALAWRLKASILRFLGIATEKGTGIRNPAGIFFALTKSATT